MKPTSWDLAWAAGILEGEGSIRINSPTTRNLGALIVSVTSTDPDMLAPLVEWFGGSIRATSTRAGCKPATRWTCASREAAAVLVAVRPYCRVARIRAKISLALEYQAQKVAGAGNRSPEYRAAQRDYFARMKVLNMRGAA